MDKFTDFILAAVVIIATALLFAFIADAFTTFSP